MSKLLVIKDADPEAPCCSGGGASHAQDIREAVKQRYGRPCGQSSGVRNPVRSGRLHHERIHSGEKAATESRRLRRKRPSR
jgi:hypothetical protein